MIKRRYFPSLLLVTTSILALSSCAGMSGLLGGQPQPKIHVNDVALGTANLQKIELQVGFTVENPYAVTLPVMGLRYKVWIAGVQLAEGRVAFDRPIPARGSAPLTTTLAFGPIDAARAATRLATGSRRYRISGTFTVRTPVGEVAVQVSGSGKLSGRRLPGLGLGRLL